MLARLVEAGEFDWQDTLGELLPERAAGTPYADVTLAPGVRLHAGVHLEGTTAVGADAVLGPDVYAVDTTIGERSRIWYSVLREVTVGDEVEVGPYASLRPGTVLEASAKAGTFVEMKNAVVGEGAKVPHLSYMGDEFDPDLHGAGNGTRTRDPKLGRLVL